MRLSYLIISYNRRETLLANLARLPALTPAGLEWEAWVVDNGSTDGSADAVANRFPWAHLVRSRKNRGMPARNLALPHCQGDFVMLLDDDSYAKDPDAIARLMTMLETQPAMAAVSGRVLLRDGREEASALPGVFIGCATLLRSAAVKSAGGFARDFFRQAEEYDLSFRLWAAGNSVGRCEDAEFWHDKSKTSGETAAESVNNGAASTSRSSALVHCLDMRNNLVLADRYFPEPLWSEYQADWTQRYALLARHARQRTAAARGRWLARIASLYMRRNTLTPELADQLLGLSMQADAVAQWSERNQVRSVVIADYSKNIYATWNACRRAGLAMTAIADDHRAYLKQKYREISIMPTERALSSGVSGVVLSNVNPAQSPARFAQLRRRFNGPILAFGIPATPQPKQHAA